MASTNSPEPRIFIVPSSSLPGQPFWWKLHSTIITSFKNKDVMAFPPTWTRLDPDPARGANGLKEELGPDGVLAVVLLDDEPVACAGALPFRGPNWIDHAKSKDGAGGGRSQEPDEDMKMINVSNTDKEHALHTPNEAALFDWDPKTDWELCCFCIHPSQRKKRLSPVVLGTLINHLKSLGAKRLFSNYVIEETGRYWPHIGFETIPGAGGILKKGFTAHAGMEGLRADIHFAMGVKAL